MYLLKKHPLFDADLEEAACWYGARNPAVAMRLIDEAAVAVRVVLSDPLRFSIWEGEVRRVHLRRFPYLVFYEFRDNTIYLTAFAHGARDLVALLEERRVNP